MMIVLLLLVFSPDCNDPFDEILILGVISKSDIIHASNLKIWNPDTLDLHHGSSLHNSTFRGAKLLKFCLVLQVGPLM